EIDNAERKLAIDKKALKKAKDKREADERACNGSSSSSKRDDDDDDDDDDDGPSTSGSPGLNSGLVTMSNPACSQIPADKQAVVSAKQQVVISENAVQTAKRQRDQQKASGELSIANAEQGVVTARNNAREARSDRPFAIEAQRGAVIAQQAVVEAARRDVENATLRAPVAGTVSAINGVVGEYIGPSSGTSALAPGSDAAIPGVESASPAQASAGVAANPARPGGTQFIVLDNIDAFQVVVPFNEADAAMIEPNQKVSVAVDAVPDVTLEGTVLSVAPTGTAISGVVSYYVTIVVQNSDPRVKDGQAVGATVVTEELDNVLTVPNAAVRQENGRPTVTVVEPNGVQKSVPFEAGKVGADRTQVLSGLREGQQVLLPAAR